jgi:hypothetical protein
MGCASGIRPSDQGELEVALPRGYRLRPDGGSGVAAAAGISAAQIVKYHAVRVGGGPVVPSFAGGGSMAAEGLGMWRLRPGT